MPTFLGALVISVIYRSDCTATPLYRVRNPPQEGGRVVDSVCGGVFHYLDRV
jgi:hypothetical protein